MQSLIVGAIAVLLGVALGYWLGRLAAGAEGRLLRERVTGLETEKAAMAGELKGLRDSVTKLTGDLRASEAQVAAEQNKYAQMQTDLEKAFGDLAAKALNANNQSFLTLAKQELGGQTREAKQTLEAREAAIKNLLDPLGKALQSLDTQTRAMETVRAGAYSEVKTLVETMQKSIPASLETLRAETSQLITALRAPKTRGNWGELQLKRCVEYAGMVEYCSFAEQVSARDGDDRLLRPDMTIQLPNGRSIIVDAKTPLDAFLDAGDADPSAQTLRFAAHAERVKCHLRELAGKAYWKQFDHSPDFVVCFLPSEALFSAALEADPSLIEFGSQSNVVMATPTTLIALLKAVAYGWQQSQITENAKAIYEIGGKIYNKLATAQGHIEKLGNALRSGVDYYNKFLGAIEGKGGVFSHGRQLGELVNAYEEMPEVGKLQVDVREMESQKWSKPLLSGAAEPELALAADAENARDNRA
ncbi:MAG: DNA recombination protein RmuC [Terracidiphilus sp.]